MGICSALKITAALLFFLDWLLITYREKKELKRAAAMAVNSFTAEELLSSIISLDRLSVFGSAQPTVAWGPETIAETDEENSVLQSVSRAGGSTPGGPGDSDYNSAIEEEDESESESTKLATTDSTHLFTEAGSTLQSSGEAYPMEGISRRHGRSQSQSHFKV